MRRALTRTLTLTQTRTVTVTVTLTLTLTLTPTPTLTLTVVRRAWPAVRGHVGVAVAGAAGVHLARGKGKGVHLARGKGKGGVSLAVRVAGQLLGRGRGGAVRQH